MNQIRTIFGLKREAILLDSRLYIVKAMVAISLGYLIGRALPITRLDMVSVLLGVMYNLEAINVSGLKGGINQLLASALGAITTGFLVYLMGYQINVFVIALGIGFTLYIALKIDYRMVSPVAIFTSIYMTQLLQNDGLGNPSILLTFRLRILALGLGVAIALACNFLFSILYYRKLGQRRLEFVKIQGLLGLEKTKEILSSDHLQTLNYQGVLASVFNDIEMVKANLETMMKEKKIPFNTSEKQNLKIYYELVIQIKTLIHLAYDSIYVKENTQVVCDPSWITVLDSIMTGLKQLDFTNLKKVPSSSTIALDPNLFTQENRRIGENLNLMVDHYHLILKNLSHLN
jgi:hypothetical protein